ncbi:tetratricopeptide repeat protein [Rubinisphaera margarita]|uniref:tetratricopeptide repeat protein n=1 Tax=Rubinisphaera margarita TaxID=2909586 RepID=UPI001EE8C838|nr:tetratricopeptide repeat protein [Rubinisphaera margarita]MCG6157284.1 tetratricopeptide repeat protein [Rubinisphaera margarita]
MQSDVANPILTAIPQGPLSQKVQLLLADRKFERARETCQSLLVEIPVADASRLQERFEAVGNLFLIAIKSGNDLSLEWTLGTLNTELEQIVEQHRDSDELSRWFQNLLQLSEALGNTRRWPAVKLISRQLLKYIADQSTESQSMRIRTLNNLGSALLAENRIDDAIHVWQCAIRDYDLKAESTCAAPLSTLHNNLGELLRLQCKFPEARLHHARALQLRQERFSEDNLLVRQSRYNLAQVQVECGELSAAADQIDLYLSSFPADQPDTVERIKGQIFRCRILKEQGRFLSADAEINHLARVHARNQQVPGRLMVELHLQRLDIAVILGKESVIQSELKRLPGMIDDNHLVGSIYEGRLSQLIGRIPRSIDISPLPNDRETHLQTSMQIFRKRLVRNHPLMAQSVFDLADLFQATHRGQRGTQTAAGGLSIYENTFGEDSLATAYGLTRLGQLCCDQGQYRLVRQLMRKALRLLRGYRSVPELIQLRVYELLSHAYDGLNKPRLASWFAFAAAQQVQKTLEFPPMMEDFFVEQALDHAKAVGHTHREISLLERRIELLSEEYHPDHPAVIETMEQLGRLLAESESFDQAAACLGKIVVVRSTELGEDSPLAIELMQLTADVCRKAGQPDQAEELEDRIRQISERQSHVLSDLL